MKREYTTSRAKIWYFWCFTVAVSVVTSRTHCQVNNRSWLIRARILAPSKCASIDESPRQVPSAIFGFKRPRKVSTLPPITTMASYLSIELFEGSSEDIETTAKDGNRQSWTMCVNSSPSICCYLERNNFECPDNFFCVLHVLCTFSCRACVVTCCVRSKCFLRTDEVFFIHRTLSTVS